MVRDKMPAHIRQAFYEYNFWFLSGCAYSQLVAGFELFPDFARNVALDGAFVISRPWKDAGTWRTDRLRAASLVPLRLELSGSVSALTNAPSRATSRQNL